MQAICSGEGTAGATRVNASPDDIYYYQAKLRRDQLGY
jgi:hypothetical protein